MTLCLVCDRDLPDGAAIMAARPTHFCPFRPELGPPTPYRCAKPLRMFWNGQVGELFGWHLERCQHLSPCPEHGDRFDGSGHG